MKKSIITLIALFAVIALNQAPAQAMGGIYTNSTYPVGITSSMNYCNVNNVKPKCKVGVGESVNIMGVEMGDAGINAAAKNAGIKKIHHVDMHVKSILFFFKKLTVKVYGE